MSFILTMWYVNEDREITATFENNSFILTMWYVNVSFTSFGAYLYCVLY